MTARGPVDQNFLFSLGELQRLMRAYADRQAARYGITRAQGLFWPRWNAPRG